MLGTPAAYPRRATFSRLMWPAPPSSSYEVTTVISEPSPPRQRGARIAWGAQLQGINLPVPHVDLRAEWRVDHPLIEEDDHFRHASLGLLEVRLEQWAGLSRI